MCKKYVTNSKYILKIELLNCNENFENVFIIFSIYYIQLVNNTKK